MTEYEATFINVDKDNIRERCKKAGAKLVKPEFLMKRKTFDTPITERGAWLRVRDEGDKITMSYKRVLEGLKEDEEHKIENQQEVCLTIDNFKEGEEFLKIIGAKEKAYQETKREIWDLDGVELAIDEWPSSR